MLRNFLSSKERIKVPSTEARDFIECARSKGKGRYELILRKTPHNVMYIRRRVNRGAYKSSPFKLMNMLQFAEICYSCFGKTTPSGQMHIVWQELRRRMKPIGRAVPVRPLVELSVDDMRDLELQALKMGVELVLPDHFVSPRKHVMELATISPRTFPVDTSITPEIEVPTQSSNPKLSRFLIAINNLRGD